MTELAKTFTESKVCDHTSSLINSEMSDNT